MSADPVRRRAVDLLVQVDQGGQLDSLLDVALAAADKRGDEPRDRAFLAELVRGTLQWQFRYDHLIARYSRREAPTDPRILAVLRLTLHQLVALDQVPPYAAVHQAGELCRAVRGPRFVGFVNGMMQAARRELRPDDRTDPAGREARLRAACADLGEGSAAWLAVWHAHPRWLVERWLDRFGAEPTTALLAWNNRPVPLALRVLEPQDPAGAMAALAAADCPVAAGDDPRTLLCLERPDRAAIAELHRRFGWLLVQDPGVQQATSWLLDGVDGSTGAVLDLCAAPGGKTRRLAAAWPGDRPLVAVDHRPARVRLLRAAAASIGGRPVSLVAADGTRPPFADGSFAVVLLDGPCSGSGVLRHHPDGRHQLGPATAAANAPTLLALARRAAGLLAPGGVLLYATCSLETEENEQVLDSLLASGLPLAPLPHADGQWRRTWLPGEAGGDGFFAARLRRMS